MYFFHDLQAYIQQLRACEEKNIPDVLWCALRYGMSPANYRDYGFRELTEAQRATYVNARLCRKMDRYLNQKENRWIFEDKAAFNERFDRYLKRDWISTADLTYEAFCSFAKGKEKLILKPIHNFCGSGIRIYEDLSDLRGIYQEVIQAPAVVEQWIRQHPVLDRVYSDAVNCLRIISVYKNGEIRFLAGGVTWGLKLKIANASASGIVSPVDFETGLLPYPAGDFEGHVYEKHPVTGAPVKGLQLPFWKETLEMIKNAAREVPGVAYIGWDVAITPDGPAIIEGNTTPGYRYYQIPVHMVHKTGNRAAYEACLKD